MLVFRVLVVVFVAFVASTTALIKEKLLIGGAAAGAAGAVGAAGGFLAGSALPGLFHKPHVHHVKHVKHVHVHEAPPIKVIHEPIKFVHAPVSHGWDEGW